MLNGPGKNRLHRCVVSGGLGYAASWISRYLARSGHEVTVISRRKDKPDLGFPYSLLQADLENEKPQDLTRIFAKPADLVVHAAALTDAFIPDYPRRSLLTNALGTRNILEAIDLSYGTHPEDTPMFVYCSTIHVYGRSTGTITESSPAAPLDDYALTHFFAEEYCRMFTRAHALPCLVLRFSNGYGAPLNPASANWRLLLNNLCKSAFTDGIIRLRSDPRIRRDFIWLENFAEAISALMDRKDLAGRIFNVSSGDTLSIGEVAARTAKIATEMLGRDIPVCLEAKTTDSHPVEVRISNQALRAEIKIDFNDHMDEEIRGILRLLGAP
ncbi:MAG: SDR family oxidoreductase [Desulfovibrio sp.]|jgi:UDP-glucose 4-epimerase|nr:SDR family oxidoreductase [Desulfovibrio sp.]